MNTIEYKTPCLVSWVDMQPGQFGVIRKSKDGVYKGMAVMRMYASSDKAMINLVNGATWGLALPEDTFQIELLNEITIKAE